MSAVDLLIHVTGDLDYSDLLDPATAHKSRDLIGHAGPVYRSSFDPTGQLLLTASADSTGLRCPCFNPDLSLTARLWSLTTFDCLTVFTGHNFPVWDCEFNPLGTLFATCSADRTARLWTTEDTRCLRIFAGHYSDVHVSFSTCVFFLTGIRRLSFIRTDSTWRQAQKTTPVYCGTLQQAPKCGNYRCALCPSENCFSTHVLFTRGTLMLSMRLLSRKTGGSLPLPATTVRYVSGSWALDVRSRPILDTSTYELLPCSHLPSQGMLFTRWDSATATLCWRR